MQCVCLAPKRISAKHAQRFVLVEIKFEFIAHPFSLFEQTERQCIVGFFVLLCNNKKQYENKKIIPSQTLIIHFSRKHNIVVFSVVIRKRNKSLLQCTLSSIYSVRYRFSSFSVSGSHFFFSIL